MIEYYNLDLLALKPFPTTPHSLPLLPSFNSFIKYLVESILIIFLSLLHFFSYTCFVFLDLIITLFFHLLNFLYTIVKSCQSPEALKALEFFNAFTSHQLGNLPAPGFFSDTLPGPFVHLLSDLSFTLSALMAAWLSSSTSSWNCSRSITLNPLSFASDDVSLCTNSF